MSGEEIAATVMICVAAVWLYVIYAPMFAWRRDVLKRQKRDNA